MQATVTGVASGIQSGDAVTLIEIVWKLGGETEAQAINNNRFVNLNNNTDINRFFGIGYILNSTYLILGQTYVPAARVTESRGGVGSFTGPWTEGSIFTVSVGGTTISVSTTTQAPTTAPVIATTLPATTLPATTLPATTTTVAPTTTTIAPTTTTTHALTTLPTTTTTTSTPKLYQDLTLSANTIAAIDYNNSKVDLIDPITLTVTNAGFINLGVHTHPTSIANNGTHYYISFDDDTRAFRYNMTTGIIDPTWVAGGVPEAYIVVPPERQICVDSTRLYCPLSTTEIDKFSFTTGLHGNLNVYPDYTITGLCYNSGYIYVGTTNGIWKYSTTTGDLETGLSNTGRSVQRMTTDGTYIYYFYGGNNIGKCRVTDISDAWPAILVTVDSSPTGIETDGTYIYVTYANTVKAYTCYDGTLVTPPLPVTTTTIPELVTTGIVTPLEIYTNTSFNQVYTFSNIWQNNMRVEFVGISSYLDIAGTNLDHNEAPPSISYSGTVTIASGFTDQMTVSSYSSYGVGVKLIVINWKVTNVQTSQYAYITSRVYTHYAGAFVRAMNNPLTINGTSVSIGEVVIVPLNVSITVTSNTPTAHTMYLYTTNPQTLIENGVGTGYGVLTYTFPEGAAGLLYDVGAFP